jgi:hypothetical protein
MRFFYFLKIIFKISASKTYKKLIFNKNKKIKIFKNTSWPPIQTGFFFLEKLKANNTSSMEEDNAPFGSPFSSRQSG